MLLFQQMLVLFIIMFLGFWCGKKGVISDESSKTIAFIVVNIANPALILSASVNGDAVIKGKELLYTFLLAIVVFAVLILLSMMIPRVLRVDSEEIGIYKVMVIFSNIGFMGFPIISATFGASALLYASLFLFPFNILIYTYGIVVMKQNAAKERLNIGKIFNVGVIACIVSLIIYLLHIPMASFVKNTVSNLSGLTAPLSMLVIGQSMIYFKLKELFTDSKLLIFSFLKLLVIPILGTLLIKQFESNTMIVGVCMIMLATPVGSMTAMLAQQYDGNHELASKGVALTTVLSVVTIPIVSAIVM